MKTYNKDDFKLPMDTIITEPYKYITTGLPDSAYANGKNWRMTPELPFWWFLSPWKTCEDLQLSLLKATADYCDDAKERDDVTDRLNQTIYDLQNELATVKAERDAANDAVRTLRKKGKRRG